jgi:adenylylsulfate kinase
MRNLADFEKGCGRTVICDFVCPTKLTRYIFEADYVVWLDTIDNSHFEDTNRIFEKPQRVDYHVSEWFDNTDETLARAIYRHIRKQNVQ